MAITRYQPWGMLDQLQRQMNHAFDPRLAAANSSNTASSDWTPAVDIKETKEAFVIEADIPGVDPAEIEIHMEDGVLSIHGERESESKEEREGYKRVERSRGSFYRRFSLPDTADAENINAKSSHGVLAITIPKQEKAHPRKISVEH